MSMRPGLLSREQVHAVLRGTASLSEAATDMVKQDWKALVAQKPQVFDGPMCSVINLERDGQSLRMDLVRSRYSHYTATRTPNLPEGLREADRCNPLGLTALLLTSDGLIVASLRSQHVDQNPGALYFTGGYAEPGETDGEVDLFAEIAREVVEELGVTLDQSKLRLMSVEFDPEWIHPEAFFLAETALSFEQIEMSAKAAADRREINQLIAVPMPSNRHDEPQGISSPLTWSFRTGWTLLCENIS